MVSSNNNEAVGGFLKIAAEKWSAGIHDQRARAAKRAPSTTACERQPSWRGQRLWIGYVQTA